MGEQSLRDKKILQTIIIKNKIALENAQKMPGKTEKEAKKFICL